MPMLWASGTLSHHNFPVPPRATSLGTGSSFIDTKQLGSTTGPASIAAFTPLPISAESREKEKEREKNKKKKKEKESLGSTSCTRGSKKTRNVLLCWCLEKALGTEQRGSGSVLMSPLHPHGMLRSSPRLPKGTKRFWQRFLQQHGWPCCCQSSKCGCCRFTHQLGVPVTAEDATLPFNA